MFRRALACVLCLCLLAAIVPAFANTIWFCPNCGRQNQSNYCPVDGVRNPLAVDGTPVQTLVIVPTATPIPTATPTPTPVPTYAPTYAPEQPVNVGSGGSAGSLGGGSVSEGGSSGGKQPGSKLNSGAFGDADSVWGLATMKLATRTGPTTGFTEPGTFHMEGKYVEIFSIAYDDNGTPWVQCEIYDNGLPKRVYTGLKRFDTSSMSVYDIPDEADFVQFKGKLNKSKTPTWGPGDEYTYMSGLKLTSGTKVTVTWAEGEWYQIQFKTPEGVKCRGWIKMKYID